MKTWPIERKASVWITRPLPSGHPQQFCMPINIILRDLLKITKTTSETKKLLQSEKILLDNVEIKDYRRAVGLFDRLSIPLINKFYTIVITRKGKLKLIEISKENAAIKPLKIINKNAIKGNRLQLTFHDGRTMIGSNELNKYKVNDSVIFDLGTKKIISHLPLVKSALVYIIAGKHVGKIGLYSESVLKGYERYGIVTFGSEKTEIPIKNLFVINEMIVKELENID